VAVSGEEADLVRLSARANFRRLGPRFGARMPEAAAAIAGLGLADLERILDGGTVTIADEELGADDVIVDRSPRDGTAVETGTAMAMAVALDTSLSEELLQEGIAREVISRVQRMRREASLDVTDRIHLAWSSDDPSIRDALRRHEKQISSEVLASSVEEGLADAAEPFEIDGAVVTLGIRASGAGQAP
jgi:isoleucyl-tRNA synthetase